MFISEKNNNTSPNKLFCENDIFVCVNLDNASQLSMAFKLLLEKIQSMI